MRDDRPARCPAGQAGRQKCRRFAWHRGGPPLQASRHGLRGGSRRTGRRGESVNVPLAGPVANAVTRGYHLSAMSGNRARVLADWALNAITPTEATSFGVISAKSVPLDVDNPQA